MPAKLKVDWQLAFDLFTRGLTYKDIAGQLGCKEVSLRSHGARNNWSEKVAQSRLAVASVVQNMVHREQHTVQKRAEKWVEREVNAVERITDALDSVPIPSTITGLREHVEVRAMNGKYGRSTFGLDQQGVNVQINVGRFKSIEPEQAIDITPGPTSEA